MFSISILNLNSSTFKVCLVHKRKGQGGKEVIKEVWNRDEFIEGLLFYSELSIQV